MPPLSPLYDSPHTVRQHSLCHFKLQMGDREDNISTSCLKPCTSSSSNPTAELCRAASPGGSFPPLPHRQSAFASTLCKHQCQQQVTLEPFPGKLAKFLHAQRIHLQAATCHATEGRLPDNRTSPSLLVSATKKLGGALWAPPSDPAYTPRRITSTGHDHTTSRHCSVCSDLCTNKFI
jgi:hypothetical protein